MDSQISPKVLGGSFGAALAGLFWAIAAATFWADKFTDTELAALVGSTAVVISGLIGYLVPDKLRQVLPEPVMLAEPAPASDQPRYYYPPGA